MNTGMEFALARIHDQFNARWKVPSERRGWARVWAEYLGFATIEELHAVAEFCITEMSRCPTLPEFRELVERRRRNEPLSEPIVSIQERLAFLILTSDEFADADSQQLSDACLIASAALDAKLNSGLRLGQEGIATLFSGRARMFATEAQHWQEDAQNAKGYWTFFFGSRESGN